MARHGIYSTLLLVFCGLLFACQTAANFQCSDPLGCLTVPPGEPVRIAYLLELSGARYGHGFDALDGIELAVGDAQGNLLGHPIELVGEDAICRAEGLLLAARRVALQRNLLGTIGPACAQSVESAASVLGNAGLVVIALKPATLPPTPVQARDSGLFRLAGVEAAQGRLAAAFGYRELGARSAGILYESNPSSDGLQNAFREAFESLGGEIVFQIAIPPDRGEVQSYLLAVADSPPDLLYFPVSERLGTVIPRQVGELSALKDMTLMSADELLVAHFPSSTGMAAEGMYLTGLNPDAPGYADFLTRWVSARREYPASTDHAFAYDAVRLLLQTTEEVAVQTEDGSLHIARQALRQVVGALRGYEGISGEVNCNPFGECVSEHSLGIYTLTKAEIEQGSWPPKIQLLSP